MRRRPSALASATIGTASGDRVVLEPASFTRRLVQRTMDCEHDAPPACNRNGPAQLGVDSTGRRQLCTHVESQRPHAWPEFHQLHLRRVYPVNSDSVNALSTIKGEVSFSRRRSSTHSA